MMNPGLASLLVVLALAVFTDMRTRKVPNLLIVGGLLAAAGIQVMASPGAGILERPGGAIGLLSALGGIAVGFISLLPLYLLRAMGAGDVKLMMVVGAFLGPHQTVGVVALTFIAGGLLALVMALWQRSFRQLAVNLRFMLISSAVRAAGGASPRFEPLQQTAGRMPYALAIAAGTLMQLILVRSGGWALS